MRVLLFIFGLIDVTFKFFGLRRVTILFLAFDGLQFYFWLKRGYILIFDL